MPNVPDVSSFPPSGPGAEIGDGPSNTSGIVTDCATAGIAAHICDQYDDEAGHDDWFLPSIGEQSLMFLNLQDAVHGFALEISYWSSTEYNEDWARVRNFEGGLGLTFKNDSHYVRAVRAFNY